ncbi:sensor domain-containing protein [Halobacteria archaeon HArc-gm2]|nr:sensor domain-containing protein [Halobacteria archaeon HArc-gm2]
MSVRAHPAARVPGPVRWFVGVLSRRQTYRNLVYLALTFPLGLGYFVLLTTGLSVGFSLLVFLVGLPILVGVLLLSDRILVFERWLAARLLGVDVPLDRETEHDEVWDYLRSPLADLGTWVGLVYLASKFVVGLFTFILMTLLGTLAGSFVLAPLYYRQATIQVSIPEPIHLTLSYAVQQWDGVEVVSLPVTITSWQVTSLSEAVGVAVVGVLLFVVSLHLLNLLARIQGWYTRVLITPRPLT